MSSKQPLGTRQRHRDMSAANKALHPRTLLVKVNKDIPGVDKRIVWADDPRIPALCKGNYVVAEENYVDPLDTGRKKDVVVIRVPMKSLNTGQGDGVGIEGP